MKGPVHVIPFLLFLSGVASMFLMSSLVANISPKVRYLNHVITINSGWQVHFLSLGFGSRYVEIDATKKIVHIFDRRFWVLRSTRRLEFEWMDHIELQYSLLFDPLWSGKIRNYERLSLLIILKNSESVILARFLGKGDYSGSGNFHRGPLIKSVRGVQQEQSFEVAKKISELISVPIKYS